MDAAVYRYDGAGVSAYGCGACGEFQRGAEFGGQQVSIINPATGRPYTNNTVPVSTVAANLLKLYPLPNLTGSQYNYEIPILNSTHTDSLQSRLNKNVTKRDNVYGGFSFQDIRNSNANLFGFTDKTNTLGITGNINDNPRLISGFTWLRVTPIAD